MEIPVQVTEVHNAVVTCEINFFGNNFEIISVFYFTCNHVGNYFKIISEAYCSSCSTLLK